jgi:hypothetical protein
MFQLRDQNLVSKINLAQGRADYGRDRAGWGVSVRIIAPKGYVVHSIKRRSSSFNTERINHLYQDPQTSDQRSFLHYGDTAEGMMERPRRPGRETAQRFLERGE